MKLTHFVVNVKPYRHLLLVTSILLLIVLKNLYKIQKKEPQHQNCKCCRLGLIEAVNGTEIFQKMIPFKNVFIVMLFKQILIVRIGKRKKEIVFCYKIT